MEVNMAKPEEAQEVSAMVGELLTEIGGIADRPEWH